MQPIISALARVAEDAQRERHSDQAPLVLLVDQFEELFAQGVSDAERTAFAESLQQLIVTGRVWVVATLRADLYELLLKQPASAYDELGGLAGAIAAEAERAVSGLPPAAVATLPRLLRRLAEPARDGKALTLRDVLRADVSSETSEATLIDALVDARILIVLSQKISVDSC